MTTSRKEARGEKERIVLTSLGWWVDAHGCWRTRLRTDLTLETWNKGLTQRRAIGAAIKLARRRLKELEALW